MTVDFLTSFQNRSIETLIEALNKKGLTVNVIRSFNDINTSNFLIVWDPLLVPSKTQFMKQLREIDNHSELYHNFNWDNLEEWHLLNKIQKQWPSSTYPLLIVPRKNWSKMIPQLKKVILDKKVSQYLVVPSFIGHNSTEYQRQIINGATPDDDLKVASDDGFLIVYPWTSSKKQLFQSKGIISILFLNGKYYGTFKKKVSIISDLVNTTTSWQKTRAPFFLIRMGEIIISKCMDSPIPTVIQIDYYPVDNVMEWVIGRIHQIPYDDFIPICPKLINQLSSSIAKEFPEYQEKRKKILGLF